MRAKMTPCDRCHKPTANIGPGDMCNPCMNEIKEAAKAGYKMRFAEPMEMPDNLWITLAIGCHMRRCFR